MKIKPRDGLGYRLRSKLILSRTVILTWVVLTALTWGITFHSMMVVSDFEQTSARKEAISATRLFAEQAYRTIRSIDVTLKSATYEISLNHAPGRLKSLVDAGVLSMDNLVQIAFVDSQARTIGTNFGPDTNQTSVADREHIRVHLDRTVDGLFIGKPVLGRVSGKWSIQLTRAFGVTPESVGGVVVASLDPFYFNQFWRSLEDRQNVRVLLIGEDGYIRACSCDIEPIFQANQKQSNLVKLIDGVGADVSLLNSDTSFAIAGVRLPGMPLFAVAEVPQEQLNSKIEAHRQNHLALGFSISFIILGSALLSARSLIRAGEHERKAKKAEDRLQQALECIPDGIVLYDDDDRLVIANTAYREMFPQMREAIRPGASLLEIIQAGRDTKAFWPPNEKVQILFSKRVSHEAIAYEPIESQLSDGRWIRLIERTTPEGGWVGVRTDITELKRREGALMVIQEQLAREADDLRCLAHSAQRTDRAKSAFVASISHEFRTPLNAIVGFSHLIGDTKLDDEQMRYVLALQGSARHLGTIVNDILDLTRIEAGHLDIQPVLFRTDELVDNLSLTARSLIGDRPIRFVAEIAGNVPEAMMGDVARINQVLLNLLGNAQKFTENGEIKLVMTAECAGGRWSVYLELSDTGRGISPAAQAFLFKPFEQGDLSGSLRIAGTGLGLAISRGLVELMGGEIGFESEPGKGSRFFFTIPLGVALQKPAKRRSLHPPTVAAAAEPLTVLVADDAKSSRLLVSIMLGKRSHHCVQFECGEDAVERAQQTGFDLVFMDVEMPGIGGGEAVRRIRASGGPTARAYIVALTAQAFANQVSAMLDAGCDEVLIKPFEPEAFEAVLAKANAWRNEREINAQRA